MNFLKEYKDRSKNCEYCRLHKSTSSKCDSCNGNNFIDKVDFYTFLINKVKQEADKNFDESEEGLSLFNIMNNAKADYEAAVIKYKNAKAIFIKQTLSKLEDTLNSI